MAWLDVCIEGASPISCLFKNIVVICFRFIYFHTPCLFIRLYCFVFDTIFMNIDDNNTVMCIL